MKLEEFEIACTALEDMNEKLKSTVEQLENDKNYVHAQCNKLLMQVGNGVTRDGVTRGRVTGVTRGGVTGVTRDGVTRDGVNTADTI